MFLVCLAALPAAAETVGRVVKQVGVVVAQRGGETRAVRLGTEIEQGDRLVTYDASKVEVRFADGSVLSVGAATQVEVSEYLLDGGEGVRGVLHLLIGIVRTNLGGLWQDGFEVRTRAAVASLRSTDWITEMTADKAAVFVAEGTVAVTGTATAETVVLQAGEGTDVPVGGSPGAPKQWGQARVDGVVERTRLP